MGHPRRCVIRGLATVLLLGVVAAPTRALGDDQATDPAAAPRAYDAAGEARTLTDQGTQAWRRGDHAVALQYFRLAHDVYPSPNNYYNLGLALSGLGRTLEALDAFETFLRLAPEAPVETRAYAEARVVELEQQVGRITVNSNVADATATVDGNAVPLGRSIRVAPGKHTVAVDRDGYRRRELVVDAVAGKSAVQRLQLTEHRAAPDLSLAAVPPPVARPAVVLAPQPARDDRASGPGVWKRWWFWTAVGVAVAGVATTAVLLSRDGGTGCPSTDLGCIELP